MLIGDDLLRLFVFCVEANFICPVNIPLFVSLLRGDGLPTGLMVRVDYINNFKNMAKQHGIIPVTGTIAATSRSSKHKTGSACTSKERADGSRIKTDPRFVRTREKLAERRPGR